MNYDTRSNYGITYVDYSINISIICGVFIMTEELYISDHTHEYEFKIGDKSGFFTENSMIDFYDEDDEFRMRIDPTDLVVISAIYSTVMSEWHKYDKYDKEDQR